MQMKYIEDNIAEIISTEMFVKGVTREEYDDQIDSIIGAIDRANQDGFSAIQLCYKPYTGTKALLTIFGFTLDVFKNNTDEGYRGDVNISWPNFKNKEYVFVV